jgi:cell division septation protein DedD
MSSTSENETEILLGNRHLLAIFFVLAVLLGIAFTGGYMVGRNGTDKKPNVLTATGGNDAADSKTASGETHVVAPTADADTAATTPSDQTRVVQPPPPPPDVVTVPVPTKEEPPLGTPKETKRSEEQKAATKAEPAARRDRFAPESGQTFLQVAAVGHTEASALADVLSKKGFHAHAVAKPGGGDIYRVLIGPIRDASELSSTRDSLRNAGFTKIFAQKY